MKPHPRIRKTINWGGAAVTVLLVVVWIGSGWCGLYWFDGGGKHIALENGRATLLEMVGVSAHPKYRHWSFGAIQHPGLRWRPEYRVEVTYGWGEMIFPPSTGRVRHAALPVWIAVLATSLPTALAWRLDAISRRRERPGFCPKCNYDRTGLAAGAKCSECGRSPA